jgi:hypothetical protein
MEFVVGWKTTENGSFEGWKALDRTVALRLREDPKRLLAQAHYVGQYPNPKSRLGMLLARLSKRWATDPPPGSMDYARSILNARPVRKTKGPGRIGGK